MSLTKKKKKMMMMTMKKKKKKRRKMENGTALTKNERKIGVNLKQKDSRVFN